MVIYRIPVWLRIVLIWATFLLMGGEAFGQTLYKVDSASNVWSKMVGTLGSGIAAPVQIRVLTGDGAKFAKVGVPLLIKISTWGRASGYQDTSHYELDSVSAISGDTLTISKRKLSNSYQLGWNAGSRIEVAFDFPLINLLSKKIAAAAVLPSLDSGKVLSNNGSSTLWINQASGAVSSFNTRTGAVVPVSGDYSFTQITGTLGVTRGGTGLTSIASGEMLYASATNTLAQLTPNTGLSISGGNLNVSLGSFTTDNLAQGSTNKYYKDSLARAALSASAPVLYNATTGVISESQASTVSNGWLSAADYITLMAKQNALTLPLSIANGGTGQITRAAALKALLPDTTSKTGYFLKVDSTGDILWRPTSVGSAGSGTVTSVALSVPAWLTVSGSPVTTSGTLTATAANEDSAKVLIGPASGSAAAPTFRLLAATDIPNLSAAQITSGVLPVANGGSGQSSYTNGQLLIGNTSGNTLTKATLTGTSNEITVTNGTGSITLSTPQAIGTGSSPTFSALTLTNALTEANGGTAQSGYTAGDILYASATNTLSKLGIGSSGQILQVNTGLPSWQTTLGAANGGTGRTTLTANDLLIGNGTSALTLLAPGGANTVLTGSTGPSFQTLATGSTLVGNGIGTPFDIDLTHANTWTGTPTVNKANIQTTYTDGLMMENTTASDVTHTVQQSPSLDLTAHVWNTTSTATDSVETWRITNVPVSGTSTTSSLMLDNGNTAGGFSNVGSLSDAGAFNVKTGGSYQINGTSVLNATTLGSGVTASSLTSVGTIATGVWNGTTIAVANGGTGSTTNGGWFAFGNSNLPGSAPSASATDAIAIGDAITNASANSVLIGDNLTQNATGAGQIVIGSHNIFGSVASNDITIIGRNNRVVDQKAIVIGVNDTLSAVAAQGAVIIGGTTNIMSAGTVTASIIAAGENNSIKNRDAAIIGGVRDTVGTVNNSGGSHFTGSGVNSVVLGGTYLVTAAPNQVFCGQYNVPVPNNGSASTSDIWFGVGGGSDVDTVHRKNSVAITGDSKIIVGGRATTTTAGHTSWGSNTGQVKYGVSGSDFFAITTAATQAADRTYTLQDAGAAADFLFETSNLAATGSIITSTATRGVLTSVAIGSSNDILTVSAGVPSWTATPTLGSLTVTNGTTMNGPLSLHVNASTKTTTYTVLATDCVVPCDATSAGFTATLPTGATSGQVVIVSKIDGSINTVTVAPGAGQTIIAATGVLSGGNVSLTTTNPNALLCYIGSNNWILISRD